MELLLNRYRNLTALVVAILAQLILLAYQVKNDQEVRLIRVWAVSGVTPLARVLDGGRSSVTEFLQDYFILLDVREQNQRLQSELDRARMENQHLRTELDTAERVQALAMFQQQTPMKTLPARIFMNTTGSGSTVFIDRGSLQGVQRGMAVITPAGIVGKITSVYPTASLVRLVTDPAFAAGVISQKNRVHGTIKGQGNGTVMVDFVQNEQTVEAGEWFYTSGEDLIFPKGLPAGAVTVVRAGRNRKEIFVTPSGFQNNLEEVLIVIEGVHAPIPDAPVDSQPVLIQPPPPSEAGDAVDLPAQRGPVSTDADRIKERIQKLAESQHHVLGERGRGAPDFNAPLTPGTAKPAAPKPPAADTAKPKPPEPEQSKPQPANPDAPKPEAAEDPAERP
jgi:rod shape-determining protein MreC